VTIQLAPGPEADAEPPLTIPWKLKRGTVLQSNLDDSASANAVYRKHLDTILTAIAKARVWVEELTENQTTIPQIAKREGKGERYIRLLLPLAFTAPTLVEQLFERIATQGLTLSRITADFPCSWKAQAILET
jgi:hypothetical protein